MKISKKGMLRGGLILILLAAIVWLFASGLVAELNLTTLKEWRATLSAWVASHYLLAAGVFFLVYIATTAISIPGATILTLAAGALFDLFVGVVIVSFASSIGATAAFLTARFLLRDSLRARYGKRLKTFDAGVERDGAFYLFSLRLVPAFPFFIINLLAGLTALRTWTFYWVSQLGMLPATIAYVYAGTQLAQIHSLSGILSPSLIVALAILGLLPLALRLLLRILHARRVYRGYTKPKQFDYNLLVIGAGSAGLVSAYIGSAVKAKVALIEKDRMGGDCLNTGCVPSKALIRTARLLAEANDSARYGVREMRATFEFGDIMQRVQDVIRKVEQHDSEERYRKLGVDVIRGEARFVSPWEVEVDGRRLAARAIVIATGAQPLVPPIKGIDESGYLTSDTLWDLRELPRRMVVLGGGPIGCELAQCFRRFGSEVTVVEMKPRLLPNEDEDAAEQVESRFRDEGVSIATEHKALRVMTDNDVGGGRLVCEHDGKEVEIPFSHLLLALGRRANVDGFGLKELGVELTDHGTIEADAFLRTNFPNILVAGDVTGPYQFTHVAAHQAWYASVNGLIAPFWRFRADYRVIPWATFTDPEVARVGLSEDEAREQDIEVEVTRYELADLDRAIADSADQGFVKVLTKPGEDTILGATIVGAHGGELIHEFILAMKHGLGLNKLLGTIHIYPTMSEADKYVAGNWKRNHAPARALQFAEKFFAWRR